MAITEDFIGYNAVLFVCMLLFCILVESVVTHYRVWWMPASVGFIIIGFIIGLFITFAISDTEKSIVSFNPDFFFFGFLPPIIFEAGYTLKRKNFFVNLGTIFNFAVPGTVIASVVFAYLLYGFGQAGIVPVDSLIECLMFGSLISATDTVATLALMSSASATSSPPPLLFSLIFGESVLNDAVAVVLYTTFHNYAKIEKDGMVSTSDDVGLLGVFQALGYFIGVSLGSIAVGVFIALICCYIFKRLENTELHGHVEFAVVALFAYLSYAIAEIASLSGIMAIFFCSVCLAHYNYYNLSASGKVTTVEAFKSIARVSETFVFLFVGMTAGLSVDGLEVNGDNNGFNNDNMPINWSVSLILLSFVAVVVGRACSIFPLSYLSNRVRRVKIPLNQQSFMWFAGLRGAVAFAISMNFPGKNRGLIVSTTLTLVVVTSVLFGCLTMPTLSFLKLIDNAEFGVRLMPAQSHASEKESDSHSDYQLLNNNHKGKDVDVKTPLRAAQLSVPALTPSASTSSAALTALEFPSPSLSPSAHPTEVQQRSQRGNGASSSSLSGRYSNVIRMWKRFDANVMKKYFGGHEKVDRNPGDLINLSMRVHGHTHTTTANDAESDDELELEPPLPVSHSPQEDEKA